jgi:hypothetical protein
VGGRPFVQAPSPAAADPRGGKNGKRGKAGHCGKRGKAGRRGKRGKERMFFRAWPTKPG